MSRETSASSEPEGEWLELATAAEAEAVESVSAVFAEYGQGVAIEQAVESSRDGDIVHLPSNAPVFPDWRKVRRSASTS